MDKRVWKMLKELELAKLTLAVLILRSPFDFLNALLTAHMLERFIRIMEHGEAEKLWRTFLLFLLLSCLLFVYNMTVWSTISIRANLLLQKGLRRKVLKQVLALDLQEMEARSGGDWITRLGSDIDKTCFYLTGPLNYMHMVIALVNLLLSSVILIGLNFSLYIIAVMVMLPFFLFSSMVLIREIPLFKQRAQEKLAEYTNWMAPILTGHIGIRIFEGEKKILKNVEEISRDILRENMKAHNRMALTALCNTFSGNLGYVLLLFAGNSMMGETIQDFAMLTKITQYRGEMMRSVMCVNSCLGNMRTNLAGVGRVSEILQKKG